MQSRIKFVDFIKVIDFIDFMIFSQKVWSILSTLEFFPKKSIKLNMFLEKKNAKVDKIDKFVLKVLVVHNSFSLNAAFNIEILDN